MKVNNHTICPPPWLHLTRQCEIAGAFELLLSGRRAREEESRNRARLKSKVHITAATIICAHDRKARQVRRVRHDRTIHNSFSSDYYHHYVLFLFPLSLSASWANSSNTSNSSLRAHSSLNALPGRFMSVLGRSYSTTLPISSTRTLSKVMIPRSR